jgi:hypothetical protein
LNKDKLSQQKISWSRLIGPALLIVLLWQVDVSTLSELARDLNKPLIFLVLVLHFPLVWFKSLRWQHLLWTQQIQYSLRNAYLAYFGSLFIGLLTPGRLGEFVKAVHVSRDCDVPLSFATASVLTDRLFDLYILLVFGGAALLALAPGNLEILALLASTALLTLPLLLFFNDQAFAYGTNLFSRWRSVMVHKVLHWIGEMRRGMRMLSWQGALLAALFTLLAYGIFFGQCFLLARALNLPLSFVNTSYAVALGSLVTLIPISISGLGTREAAIIAYLGTLGLTAEAALSFSLLVFLTFYLGSGLLGALAWWIKPVPIGNLREARESV